MPYLVHGYLDGDDINTELLIWDIHFIILATSMSTPLSKVFDPVMFFKIFKRWHIRSFSKEDCPYTQKETNYWFEGHPIEIADSCKEIKNQHNTIKLFFLLRIYHFVTLLFYSKFYCWKMPTWLVYSSSELGTLKSLLSQSLSRC